MTSEGGGGGREVPRYLLGNRRARRGKKGQREGGVDDDDDDDDRIQRRRPSFPTLNTNRLAIRFQHLTQRSRGRSGRSLTPLRSVVIRRLGGLFPSSYLLVQKGSIGDDEIRPGG